MRVLVADDDQVLADVLAFTMRREGFQVIQAFDGEAALHGWSEDQIVPFITNLSWLRQVLCQIDRLY